MKILNYGSLNIDNVYAVEHIIQPGETLMASTREVCNGGKGLNQSIALARAGGEVYHAGVLGEDGDRLLDALTANGVDARYIRRVTGPSSHTIIQVDANGQNSIIVFAGERVRVTDADIEQTLAGFAAGDLLVLQNELDHSAAIMRMGAKHGLSVVFNPSPVNEGLQDYPLECVRWFVMNEIEGAALTGESEPEAILSAMERLYPTASVVLTHGADGAYCRHEGVTVFQPAFKVQPVDTTAAGDTFTGYFVTSIAQGADVADAMRLAAKAASLAVGRKGAADSIPLRAEVEGVNSKGHP